MDHNIKSNTLNVNHKDDLAYITFPSFDKTGLVNHCFTTRLGGVSSGIYASLNLGYNLEDLSENVDENYKRICDAIHVDDQSLVFSHQVHEDKVYVVKRSDKGKGKRLENDIVGKDALITNETGIPLVTFYADCVPVFLLDPVEKVIGLAHAGWRGTVKKIPQKTVEKMSKVFGSKPENIIVGIGPSIGPCHFEVGKEVVEVFMENYKKTQYDAIVNTKPNGKFLVDLWLANTYTLLDAGILPQNITVTDLCTMCHPDVFFSHRATQGKRGSLAAIMALVDH